MGSIHAAGEWLRLSEHYRGMTDGELIAIARDRTKLTEIAQQIGARTLTTKTESRTRGEGWRIGIPTPSTSLRAGSRLCLPQNSRSLDSVIEFPTEFNRCARDDSSVVGLCDTAQAAPFPFVLPTLTKSKTADRSVRPT